MTKEELDIVVEYIAASDAMHKVYGSTAVCYGGFGGAAMTPHCMHICKNPRAHEAEHERYNNAYRAVRQLAEEARGD